MARAFQRAALARGGRSRQGREVLLRRLCLLCAASLLVASAGAATLVAYRGYEYRVLDGTAPTETSLGCQDYYVALPVGGWAVAPDNADALAVTAAYHWGTAAVMVMNGESIFSALCVDSETNVCGCSVGNCIAGTYSGYGYQYSVLQSGDQYKPSNCYRRILLRRPCAAGGFHGASMTTYAEASTATCTLCGAGRYSPASGASECSNCPAGTYQPSSGASECSNCPAGTYQPSSGASECSNCPAGTYQPTSGASECSNCPAGTYQPTSGASECTDCVAGKYAAEGASTCSGSACAAGKYGQERATSSSAATCVDCPVGTFSNSTGASNCTSCFDGWTTLGPGSTFCFPMKDCLPGTWRTTDDGSCIPCEPGSFSAVNNSLGCTPCAAGKHSLVKGSSSCTARCGPGFYSTTKGESTFFSDTCQTCPRNFDAPSGSTCPSNCTCAAGFFGPTGGPCLPCPTGTFKSSVGSASSCTTCPIDGQWSPTRSVSIDDCMVIPAPVVSEVCPKRPVYHFNEPRFRRCQTPWTWETLLEGYKERRIIYKTGDLGRESVPGTFESWVCMQGDPCATDLIDGYFCYVYNEEKDIFEPWGPNNVLRLIVTRETQDEILHLRAEITNLKAVVANLTTRP